MAAAATTACFEDGIVREWLQIRMHDALSCRLCLVDAVPLASSHDKAQLLMKRSHL